MADRPSWSVSKWDVLGVLLILAGMLGVLVYMKTSSSTLAPQMGISTARLPYGPGRKSTLLARFSYPAVLTQHDAYVVKANVTSVGATPQPGMAIEIATTSTDDCSVAIVNYERQAILIYPLATEFDWTISAKSSGHCMVTFKVGVLPNTRQMRPGDWYDTSIPVIVPVQIDRDYDPFSVVQQIMNLLSVALGAFITAIFGRSEGSPLKSLSRSVSRLVRDLRR